MFKAFSGALSLLFVLLVLRSVMPEVFNLSVSIITKALLIISNVLDQADKLQL